MRLRLGNTETKPETKGKTKMKNIHMRFLEAYRLLDQVNLQLMTAYSVARWPAFTDADLAWFRSPIKEGAR